MESAKEKKRKNLIDYHTEKLQKIANESGMIFSAVFTEKLINKAQFVCVNTAEKSVIFGFDLDAPTDKDLTNIGERLAKDLEKYLNE